MALSDPGKISEKAQKSLVQYCKCVLELHKRMHDLRDKMKYVDIAYARYKYLKGIGATQGVDTAGDVCCDINNSEITVPIVVSQVDTFRGYFAEVFLSGYPLFPVVSTPANSAEAEQLTAIIDDHATRSRYAQQFMLNFFDAAKYNLTFADIEWCEVNDYDATSAYNNIQKQGATVEKSAFSINKIEHWDPYNTLFDNRVAPVNVPYTGEYAGVIKIISRIELIRKLQYLKDKTEGYNTTQALDNKFSGASNENIPGGGYYTEKPQISNILSKPSIARAGLMDWVSYLTGTTNGGTYQRNYSDMYEYIKLYVRLIPAEHFIYGVPKAREPQVWALEFINHDRLISAKRIFSIYETLPVKISQPFEDGFELQTQSIAERGIDFQEVSSKLLAIRLEGARRAINDRAIYDPTMIDQADANNRNSAPKIPLKPNSAINGKKLEDAYRSIPFEGHATDGVVTDMANLERMANMLQGLNEGSQGQFRKGNRTRAEFEGVINNSENRMRLPALAMEMQFFLPIKEQIKLNIEQYGVSGTFQNMKTGASYDITPEMLASIKKKINQFQVADGFTPASKLASTDMLVQGTQLIGNSPILQQQLGPMLAPMVIHILELGGVKGLKEYLPQPAEQSALPATTGTVPA